MCIVRPPKSGWFYFPDIPNKFVELYTIFYIQFDVELKVLQEK